MPRTDFRGVAAQRLSEERELSPAIIGLLSPEGTTKHTGVRQIPVERIDPNPDQPRMVFDQESLQDLAASIREHGVLQPVLVRPADGGRYQLVAGERRWRASTLADKETIPAIIEEIDDDTALEIAIIENLQREDLSPLDEAMMYDRMTRDHGYSLRRLAQKIGKDKGYVENRLRLAEAPEEVRELVSLRKDTISHAYELMKVEDPGKRRRLAARVASGELSLVKLRERIEGRPARRQEEADDGDQGEEQAARSKQDETRAEADASEAWTGNRAPAPLSEDSLVQAKGQLAEALEGLFSVLRSPEVLDEIAEVDRSNLAKYLTISKLKLENAITLVRGPSERR